MKEERNNEIDLLLRRMSRRDGSAAQHADDRHLDADELSAYAQNALPPAARARSIEHLAECATCRKLATELSLSLGATTAVQVETVATPGWLKQFLASLFSPLVLRYAAPALGLIVVAVVGFVVLRQRSGQSLVAQVQPRPATPAPANTPAAAPFLGAESKNGSLSDAQKEKQESGEKPASKPAAAQPERERVATDSASSAAEPPPAKTDQPVVAVQPGFAGAATAPAAAKAAPAEADSEKKAEDAAKKAPAPAAATQSVEVQNEAPPKDSSSNAQRAKENENADQIRSKPLTQARSIAGLSARPGTVARRNEESKRADEETDKPKDKASDDAETRSIAGRRFRRERGIWIDTAYDSSTATVNMARGSEQFRALVADEPVIGNIAKQLDGEVIVVWKGHAYHIR